MYRRVFREDKTNFRSVSLRGSDESVQNMDRLVECMAHKCSKCDMFSLFGWCSILEIIIFPK